MTQETVAHPDDASRQAYAALGDSYASGMGAGRSADLCGRSREGYPVLVAAALGVGVAYLACDGATVADVRAHQLGGLGEHTAYVSITVGGNDLHFTEVMTEYALPAWMADDAVLDNSLAVMHEQLPARYAGLFAAVRGRAPRARVVVAGYPRLFDGVDCNPLTFFSQGEMDRLNDAADQLATVMAKATDAAGFEFIDVRDAFLGHAICDTPEWIRGASWPLRDSFHPNALGQSAYARLVAPVLKGARASVRQLPEGAGWPVPVNLGPCRATPARHFRLADLTQRRSLEGAERNGLDPSEVAALGLRIKDPKGDARAVARLHELDAQVRAARRRR